MEYEYGYQVKLNAAPGLPQVDWTLREKGFKDASDAEDAMLEAIKGEEKYVAQSYSGWSDDDINRVVEILRNRQRSQYRLVRRPISEWEPA